MKKLSCRIVTVNRTPLFLGDDSLHAVTGVLAGLRPSRLFILADSQTARHCIPILAAALPDTKDAVVLLAGEGEESKTIGHALRLWNELSEAGADRSSLLLNLGGGVVSDLGGFVAAGYLRGIRYLNIPTSLIGQVDAAIGGKTGVNADGLKNRIGFFYPPDGVFIYPPFLRTLPSMHLRSGLAEVIKSVVLGDPKLWRKLLNIPVESLLTIPPDTGLWPRLIQSAAHYKNWVVTNDFREKKLRKALNFGHTVGHALESLSLQGSLPALTHGEAVAAGMICSAWLSRHKCGLPVNEAEALSNYIREGFGIIPVDRTMIPALLELMTKDKKNRKGKLMFSLLRAPGSAVVNTECTLAEAEDAIRYYM